VVGVGIGVGVRWGGVGFGLGMGLWVGWGELQCSHIMATTWIKMVKMEGGGRNLA
jgi:hypothetical protein